MNSDFKKETEAIYTNITPKLVTKSNKKQQSRTGNNQFAFSKKQKKIRKNEGLVSFRTARRHSAARTTCWRLGGYDVVDAKYHGCGFSGGFYGLFFDD